MTYEVFSDCVQAQVGHCLDLLTKKGLDYAPGADRLSAFKKAAAIQGCTQAQAAMGMLAKHLVSIAEMIRSGDDYPAQVWDEKIGDSVNYLLMIRAIALEEHHKEDRVCATLK